MNFEDSPTTIRLKMRYLHHDGSAVKVTIIPDNFSQRPILFGWCNPRQLVRSLYLGLLELFIIETDWSKYDYGDDWNVFRLKSYNQLQSYIIEDYINDVEVSKQCFSPRNRVVHTVNEMMSDYKGLLNSLKQW